MTRARRQTAATVAFSAAFVFACNGDAPRTTHEPVSIELGDYLPVADIRGRVDFAEGSGAAASGTVRMLAGSRMTLHFALPDGAVLVGEASTAARGGDARVRVAVTAEGSSPARAFEASAGDSTGAVSLREELSAFSGDMARISISFDADGPAGASRATLDWRTLRIEGTRAQPRAAEIARDHYNVFLIVLDSLRQDHLEPYGAAEVSTPRLKQFADTGVTFANARANASWTRAAVAAMLTSLQPPSHGVLSMDDVLAEDLPYLPEILRRSGYETIAVSNNPVVASDYGLDRGFGEMVPLWNPGKLPEEPFGDPEAQARFVWSRYLRASVRGEKPFFVYLHEMDPHSPYEPPEPYRSEYAFDYRGNAKSTAMGLRFMRRHPERVTQDDVRYIRARYRGEVSYMDRYVGWMLDRLDGVQLERPTLVVFASDHGEEFWEHRSVGHERTVYEELLRVPLMMKLAGVLPEGRRVRADVTLADVTPTILDLLGIEIPESMQGESLLPFVTASNDDQPRRASIARAGQARAPESISFGRFKLIRNVDARMPEIALYDLADDPGETRDRAAELPIVTATLEQMLHWNQYRDSLRPKAPGSKVAPDELDPAAVERLRELGYIE